MARKALLHVLLSIVTVFGILGIAMLPARADTPHRWQVAGWGYYMEMWLSSIDPQGMVIVWPYNASSSNQLWLQTPVLQVGAATYSARMNVNSGLFLGLQDVPAYQEDDRARGACGFPDQNYWGGSDYALWSFRSIWQEADSRYYRLWYNRAGCQGDAYHDMIGNGLWNTTNTYLWKESFCDDSAYEIPYNCYWKKDGS